MSSALKPVMSADEQRLLDEHDIKHAFPDIDPGLAPAGYYLVVQLRRPRMKKGGLHLSEESRDMEKWNTQVGKVRAVGPTAFRDRKTLVLWPEGTWAKVGDFIRLPKHGGDRWEMEVPGEPGQPALFVCCKDIDMSGILTISPLHFSSYLV